MRIVSFMFLWILPISVIASDPELPGRKELKEITRLFGADSEISSIQISSDIPEIRAYFTQGDALYAVRNHDKTVGYLLSTQTKGRFEYFDYSVVFSGDLVILSTQVLIYRSTHGAAVCSKGWLKQFNGYHGGKLELGKDIDSISGATFSATSMVNDVQRCFQLLIHLQKMEVIQ